MSTLIDTPTTSRTEDIPQSQWSIALRRFRRHRLAMVALALFGLVVLLAALASWIAPFPRDEPNLMARFVPPLATDGQGHLRLLGTDHLGRDLFSRLLYASRISLAAGISSALLTELLGVAIGMVAGSVGGQVDNLLMRFTELVATFPTFLLLAILANILVKNERLIPLPGPFVDALAWALGISLRETRGVALTIAILAALSWPQTARLARGAALSIRAQEYIEAARALGASHRHRIARHILPNALPTLIVDFTLLINTLFVTESALSFLGFGIQAPTATWGNTLATAQSYMFQCPWMPLVPSLPILICSLAINYIGDGLRDALDPRQRG